MKIKEIEINNFRAFYGNYKINLGKKGQNLLVYGENGSGKSSLFYALKYFFESSVKSHNINLSDLENIFIKDSQKDSNYIKITFRDTINKPFKENSFKFGISEKTNQNQMVIDANKIKAFLDYKKLLKTHLISTDKIDLFDLFVNNIIAHTINKFTQNEFITDWEELNKLLNDMINLSNRKNFKNKIKEIELLDFEIKTKLDFFNNGILELLKNDPKNSIKVIANKIITYFKYNLEVNFDFKEIKLSDDMKTFENTNIFLKVKFHDNDLSKHHFFLNEAKLTSIALSLYFSSILTNPQENKYKILVLDDIFIGLDMANREPIIDILKEKFSEYQIFITTYDKQWFELFRQYTESDKNWKYLQIYAKKLHNKDFEIPLIDDNIDFIAKAEEYLNKPDYKASAVYIRTAFEEILKRFCDENSLKIKYKLQQKNLTSDDFWEAVVKHEVKIYTNRQEEVKKVVSTTLKNKIEKYRGLVMNPFSHNDLEKPQFKRELRKTIEAVKELKESLFCFKRVTIKKSKK